MSQRQVKPVGSNDSVRGTGAGALALKGLPIEAAEVCAAARRLSPNFGSIVGVDSQRLLKVTDGDSALFGRLRRREGKGSKEEVVRIEAFWPLPTRSFDLRPLNAGLDDRYHPIRNLVLQVEDVLERAIKTVGPQVGAGLGLDKLHGDAHAQARLANTPFKHVTHAELAAHPPNVNRLSLVGEARIARDDEQPLDT